MDFLSVAHAALAGLRGEITPDDEGPVTHDPGVRRRLVVRMGDVSFSLVLYAEGMLGKPWVFVFCGECRVLGECVGWLIKEQVDCHVTVLR